MPIQTTQYTHRRFLGIGAGVAVATVARDGLAQTTANATGTVLHPENFGRIFPGLPANLDVRRHAAARRTSELIRRRTARLASDTSAPHSGAGDFQMVDLLAFAGVEPASRDQ